MADTAELLELRAEKEKLEKELDLAHAYLAGIGKLDHFRSTIAEVATAHDNRPSAARRQSDFGTWF